MRRVVTRIAVCTLFTLAVATIAWAATASGTWTQTDVQLGTWQETFDGGAPGQVGNQLSAAATGGQWTLSPMTLGPTPAACDFTPGTDANGPYNFTCVTPYAGGSLTVQNGVWGDGFTAVNLTGTNYSTHYANSYLGFTFIAQGQAANGLLVTVEAKYYGRDATTPPPPAAGGHTGETELFEVNLSIEARPIPALGRAGLAALVLALLAVGALAIRRFSA